MTNPVRVSTANMARRHAVDPGAPLLERGGGGMIRPEGFSAVMAHRVSAPDDLDYFPTPPWAARAGAILIRSIDPEPGLTCWEPAAGGGHMAWGLEGHFVHVWQSDIHDHGASAERPLLTTGDFLDPNFAPEISADWIVTNPPFVKGEAFVREAWRRANRGVAMLLRLQFLEGGARFRLFHDLPLHAVAPFSERVPMVKGRWDPEASSATAYAWFIWVKPGVPGFGAAPVVQFIGPGTRAALSRAEDVIAFCGEAVAPLFDSLSPTPQTQGDPL